LLKDPVTLVIAPILNSPFVLLFDLNYGFLMSIGACFRVHFVG